MFNNKNFTQTRTMSGRRRASSLSPDRNIQSIIDQDEDEQWADALDLVDADCTHAINNHGPTVDPSSEQRQSASAKNLVLHEAVFKNDLEMILKVLQNRKLSKKHVNQKDMHGNTPLHLACMLGRSVDLIGALLERGAIVETKNIQRWSPISEACSYGNRDIITLLTKRLKDEVYDALHQKNFSTDLKKIRNYRLVLRWEFQSWIPFLTKVLPSDVCVINKQDGHIRIDTKLLDFEMLSWKQGDSYLVYSNKFKKKWIIVDNKTKRYQHLVTQTSDKDLEDKVDELMSSDIIDIELKSREIEYTRSTCGWIWKEGKNEVISNYNSALYNFHNVFLVTRKRREHLTDEDLKRNKAAYKGVMDVLKFGKGAKKLSSNDEDEDEDENGNEVKQDDTVYASHRESLPPPPVRNVFWSEYISSKPGEHPCLGREPKIKIVKTAFKANVAMSQEFPMTKSDLLQLISIIPLKHFKKMKEFIEMRLPDGFPIRLDIPVFPFLTARITFEDFAFCDGPIDEALFSIPSDYLEDKNLFATLTGRIRGQQQQV